MSITYHIFTTELGPTLAGFIGNDICCLHFADSSASLLEVLQRAFPKDCYSPINGQELQRVKWLEGMITARLAGSDENIEPPLAPRGSQFQKKVWDHLRTIPRGETRTYLEVAKAIGSPQSVRAVANACGQNPIAILIPCHRVMRSDGSLGGFRWGLERKRKLLSAERSARFSRVSYHGSKVTGDIPDTA
jgi:AraC family transcriptional regulator of adaptative response/methylated-DNA-[protein]-cysteine methyltransferase